MQSSLLLGITAALGLFGAACGGKVFIDVPGAGGGGAGGSSSTTTPPADAPPFCGELCDALAANGCGGSECVPKCAAIADSALKCASQMTAYASCLTMHLPGAPGCVFEPCANTLGAEYEGCVTSSKCDKGTMGSDGAGGCVGKGICSNGVELGAQCDAQGNCACFSNSSTLGTCHETGPFICDFFNGCCAPFLGTGP